MSRDLPRLGGQWLRLLENCLTAVIIDESGTLIGFFRAPIRRG